MVTDVHTISAAVSMAEVELGAPVSFNVTSFSQANQAQDQLVPTDGTLTLLGPDGSKVTKTNVSSTPILEDGFGGLILTIGLGVVGEWIWLWALATPLGNCSGTVTVRDNLG